MRYEINVSKHGRQFFTAHPVGRDNFVAVAAALMEKFPAREGYFVTAISVPLDTHETQAGC